MRIAITASSFDLANLPPELTRCELVMNTTGTRLDSAGVSQLVGDRVEGAIAGLEPFDAVVLSRAVGLRAVSRIGTGVDNVDVDEANRLGIAVLRTPDAPMSAVAELTLTFILAGLRHLLENHRRVLDGTWKGVAGGLLEGRMVGLVGAGRIAQAVAQRLRPFGANIQATDPFVDPEHAPFPLVALDELLSTSDIVSLHLPAQQGRVLLDRQRIGLMRPGAMLINTARGELVDESALDEALRSGHLAFAGVDAHVVEPYRGPIRDLSNVLLTPHIGSNTIETRRAMEREAALNLVMALGLKS